MPRRVGIKDVAQKANVSISTVSHVLNKTHFVSDEMTQRVLKALEETNYRPNSIAKALRQDKTLTIGIIIPDIINPFFANLVNSIEMELAKFGYNIILCHSRDDLAKELQCISKLTSWGVDGMIIAPASPVYDYSGLDDKEDLCPMVFVDRRPNMDSYDGVFYDLCSAFRCATEKLVSAGHKKIGFIHGPIRFTTTRDRLTGYLETLEAHEIPVCEERIVIKETTVDGGYEAAKQLIENTDITAVIIANGKMSLGAMKYLGEKNVSIPNEIAVIGFEATEWTEIVHPVLTSIRENVHDMGVSAAKLMVNVLKDPESTRNQIVLAPYLTNRSSY